MSVRAVRAQRAFTLIEMLVVIVIAGVVLALVAPSFREMILMKRLSGINSQLVTDLQYARSEAVTRNTNIRFRFRSDASITCYTMFTYTSNFMCDCLLATACGHPTLVEVRTVRVPTDSSVRVAPVVGMPDQFAFESITGAMWRSTSDAGPPTVPTYTIETSASSDLKLWTIVNLGGRPTVCAPAGSRMQVAPCS